MPDRGIRLRDQSLNFVEGQVRPKEDWLLIKSLPPHLSQTISADWNGEPVRGQVVEAGPGKYPNLHKRYWKAGKDGRPIEIREIKKSKIFRPTEVKPGDIVHLGGMELGGYLWKHVLIDNVDHIWAMEADVCGIEE